jgi:hypothetical protein
MVWGVLLEPFSPFFPTRITFGIKHELCQEFIKQAGEAWLMAEPTVARLQTLHRTPEADGDLVSQQNSRAAHRLLSASLLVSSRGLTLPWHTLRC